MKMYKKFVFCALSTSLFLGTFGGNTAFAAHDHVTFGQAKSYEASGNYKAALDTYKRYLTTSDDIWSAPYAKAKLIQMTPILETYYESNTQSSSYYGAKFEPKSGVLFGATESKKVDGLGLPGLPNADQESIGLQYLEFPSGQFTHFQGDAPLVILAWNTDAAIHGGNKNLLANIKDHSAYIDKTLDALNSSGRKVLLRFANEMNVGPNGDPDMDDVINASDKENYINAFRYISEKAKPRENIAMVWAPNDVGAINRTFADYYPGDTYVDWIGVSLYPLKYFQGAKPTSSENQTYFFTGPFANPMLRLANIDKFMKENNINKPLVITEGAAAHSIHSATVNEDTTNWADRQVRIMYEELPRYYPNLKAIAYFNKSISWETYDYALTDSPHMTKLYVDLTNGPQFISEGRSPVSFKKIDNARLEKDSLVNLSSVAYYPNAENIKVEYVLDGNSVFNSETTPYKYTLDTSALSNGTHELTVKTIVDGSVVNEQKSKFEIATSTKVRIDGREIKFDLPPVVINGRNFYPLVELLENLGATRSWDDATKTSTGTLNGKTVAFTLDSNLYKNNGVDAPMEDGIIPFMNTAEQRVYVPIAYCVEALGFKASWDSSTSTININR